MLTIVTGDYRDFESDSHFYYHLGNYFQAMYEDAWFLDSFAERVIKDVDHVDLEGRGVDALWANRIPPDRISGGSQTLLCLRHTNIWTSLSRMGENSTSFCKNSRSKRTSEWRLLHTMLSRRKTYPTGLCGSKDLSGVRQMSLSLQC